MGKLNLNSLGLEGAPLLGVELLDCDLASGISLDYAYIKSIVLRSTESYGATILGPVSARGVTIIDELRLVRVKIGIGCGLDFSDSRLKGGAKLIELSADPLSSGGITGVSFARAIVGSNLVLEGVRIEAKKKTRYDKGYAFDGEELQVGGTLRFGCSAQSDSGPFQRCDLVGSVHLRGAKIGGQLLLEALRVTADPIHAADREEGVISLPTFDPAWALMAEESEIGGDVFFIDHLRDKTLSCDVKGQIDIAGSRIGGDLHVFGDFNATTSRIRAFRAQRIRIGGDLRFGWLPGDSQSSHRCDITGECDFSEATIGGKVLLSGSTHRVSWQFRAYPGLERKRKQAIDLKGTTVNGDVRLDSGQQRRCYVEGLALTGATVGGRLLLLGVEITGPEIDGNKQKAISANGSTIRGGIFAEYRSGFKQSCELNGDVRLRNATINGPVIFGGVKMVAGESGVALWASNTRFGSDLLFNPMEEYVPEIRGEIRLRGARVEGQLLIQGAVIEAQKTGVALDCFTAKVDKTFALGSFCPDRQGRSGIAKASAVLGLVSLAHMSAQHATIGANPMAAPKASDDRLTLAGTILMREMRVEAATVIANLLITPANNLADENAKTSILRQLKTWGVYRPYVVIHANYAKFGSRLFVRFEDGSCGLVSLYGASTGTIGAFSGSTEIEDETLHIRPTRLKRWKARFGLSSGKEPNGSTINSQQKVRENWGGPFSSPSRGKPLPESDAKKTILLNIDEFTYTRTNDLWEKPPRYYLEPKHLLYWLFGRPTPGQLGARYLFVQRLIENSGSEDQANISAHRQLARVYRDMGQLELSYRYTRERRWLQIRFGKLNWVQKLIDTLYSAFFGFGYSPARALATILILLLTSVWFIRHGMKEPTPHGDTPQCDSVFCYPTPDHHELSRCHLPGDDPRNEWTEGAKMIIPFTRFESGGGCVLHTKARLGLRIEFTSIQVMSWILFPFAAATLTGVLRESHGGN